MIKNIYIYFFLKGQDLTKVSLPSVFLYPYSVLELGGLRFLSFIHLLLK